MNVDLLEKDVAKFREKQLKGLIVEDDNKYFSCTVRKPTLIGLTMMMPGVNGIQA